MAIERLQAMFSLRSPLCFRWTGKCFEIATSPMQTANPVPKNKKAPLILLKDQECLLKK